MDSSHKSSQNFRNTFQGFVGFLIFLATLYLSFFEASDSMSKDLGEGHSRVNKVNSTRKVTSIKADFADGVEKTSLAEDTRLPNQNENSEQMEQERENHQKSRNKFDDCSARIKQQRESETDFLNRFRSKVEQKVGSWLFDPEWLGQLPKNEKTVEGKFLLALAYAGMLQGLPKNLIYLDYEKAMFLLGEVSALVPKNSAPLLYQAIIQNKRGKTAASINLKQSAFSTTYFDSYETTVQRELWDLVETSSDLSVSFEFWGNVPIPNFIVLRELLTEPEDAFFSDQMLKQSLNPKNLLEGYDWNALRHQFGRAIRKKTTGQEDIPNFVEIDKEKRSHFGEKWTDSDAMTEEYLKSCDLSHFEDFLTLIKNHRTQKL